MHESTPGLTRFLGTALPSSLSRGINYQLQQKLGEGATAVAFLAVRHAPEGQSPVVIKMILPGMLDESDGRAMTVIKKEAVALGRLNERVPPSPYVVRLVDTGSVSYRHGSTTLELPWLALEYVHGGVEGTTLSERVTASVRTTGFAFDPARAAHCIRSLASGLTEIHAEGVVHRDLTPGNVLCCGAGDSELFKISDFGFARPTGLSATFGDAVVGTPGYVAIEQLDPKLSIGPTTDVFSLAAISYFVLTHQHYFQFRSVGESIIGLQRPERPSLLDAQYLAPELRARETACRAIDMALASATSVSPEQRPQSARQFAEGLLPWIWRERSPTRPSRRWVTGLSKMRPAADLAMRQWRVMHPPGDDRVVFSAAWNAAGHALCATTDGLRYWNGTEWLKTTTGLPISMVHFVRRLSPTSWLLGGEQGRLIEYSREGCRELVRSPDRAMTFADCLGEFEDMLVALANKPREPPLLCALVGSHWLKPLPVSEAATITGLARVDDESWLVVGRRRAGGAYAALYHPLLWELEALPVPEGRALLGCASRWERQEIVAVGSQGLVLEVDQGQPKSHVLPSRVDLSSVAIDSFGHKWATSTGCIWWASDSNAWSPVHREQGFTVPFISVTAEVGMVCAMTADGAVLECRSESQGATVPA